MNNWRNAQGDVTPSEPISTIIFSADEGSLRTDTARRIVPLALAHNYNQAMLAAPHDTIRKSVQGSVGTTTITLDAAAIASASGIAFVPFLLVKITTQSQFSVPSGGIQVKLEGETQNGADFSAGPYDVLRGAVVTNFAIIPVIILESGKYAVPVNGSISPSSSVVLTVSGTTVNDTIEVMLPGPGAVEALAILDAAGLAGLAMGPNS